MYDTGSGVPGLSRSKLMFSHQHVDGGVERAAEPGLAARTKPNHRVPDLSVQGANRTVYTPSVKAFMSIVARRPNTLEGCWLSHLPGTLL